MFPSIEEHTLLNFFEGGCFDFIYQIKKAEVFVLSC